MREFTEQELVRREKCAKLRELGLDPFGHKFERSATAMEIKEKYADVDAQFKLIKAERAALKKQVKTVEKRIKEIDKAKEKIRKNML